MESALTKAMPVGTKPQDTKLKLRLATKWVERPDGDGEG
jgi:hypothetical protein